MIQHTFSFRTSLDRHYTCKSNHSEKFNIPPPCKKKKIHPVNETSTTTKFNLKNSSQTQCVSNVCNEKARISNNYVHRAPSSHVEQILQRSCNNCNNSSRQRKTQAEIAISGHGGGWKRRNFIRPGSMAAWTTFSNVEIIWPTRYTRTHTVCMVDTRHGRKSVTFCRVGRRTLTFPNGNTGGWRSFKSGVTNALNPRGIYYSVPSVIFLRFFPSCRVSFSADFRISTFDNHSDGYHPAKTKITLPTGNLYDFPLILNPYSRYRFYKFHSLMNFET